MKRYRVKFCETIVYKPHTVWANSPEAAENKFFKRTPPIKKTRQMDRIETTDLSTIEQ